jgi:TolA-binding protein
MKEIFEIADQLLREGIQPTTALVKHRLQHPVSMATLISAMQRWKSQPHPVAATTEATQPEATVIAATATSLEQQISELKQEIQSLTARLERLEHRDSQRR